MSDDATRMMPPASPGGSGGQTGTFDRADGCRKRNANAGNGNGSHAAYACGRVRPVPNADGRNRDMRRVQIHHALN